MEELVLESLFEAVAILDKNGKIEFINQSFATLFSVSPRKAKKFDHFWDLINDQENNLESSFKESSQSNQIFLSKELLLKTPRELSVVIKIVPSTENKFALFFLDTSVETNLHLKYKSTLTELKSVYAQMVQADKLTSLNEITASISHEISNPLTIAMGNAELALSLSKGQVKLCKTLEELQESLERIVVIMDDMRDFLEKNEDKKSYCSWDSIIKNSLKFVTKNYEDNHVNLEIDLKKNSLIGFLNQTKMEQVIINLLSNALHAVMETNKDQGKVQLVLDEDEHDLVILSIKDNGIGIPDHLKEEIFKPFFTTKEEGMGSGLGLSISEKIISSMNGQITVESDGKSGSTFQIKIPSVEISSYIESTVKQHSNNNSTTKNILVIDSDPNTLNHLLTLLEGNQEFDMIGSSDLEKSLEFIDKASVELILIKDIFKEHDVKGFKEGLKSKNCPAKVLTLTSKNNNSETEIDLFKYTEQKDLINLLKRTLPDRGANG